MRTDAHTHRHMHLPPPPPGYRRIYLWKIFISVIFLSIYMIFCFYKTWEQIYWRKIKLWHSKGQWRFWPGYSIEMRSGYLILEPINVYAIIFSIYLLKPSVREGCDARSIFKQIIYSTPAIILLRLILGRLKLIFRVLQFYFPSVYIDGQQIANFIWSIHINDLSDDIERYWFFRLVSSFSLQRNHHHPDPRSVLTARIPITLSRHPSQSTIAQDGSSRRNPMSAQNWWMYVFAGRPILMNPCGRFHWIMLFMSLFFTKIRRLLVLCTIFFLP